MNEPDAAKLIQKYLDDVATDADLAELYALVRRDPQVADAFVGFNLLDTELARHFSQEAIEKLFRGLPKTLASTDDERIAAARTDSDAVAEMDDSSLLESDFGSLERPCAAKTRADGQASKPSTLGKIGNWKPWIAAAAVIAVATLGIYFRGHLASNPNAVAHANPGPTSPTSSPSSTESEGKRYIAGATGETIRLSDGTSVELEPKAVAMVKDDAARFKNRSVELQQGAGRFKIAPQHAPFEVITSVGRVAALGTQFTVALSPANPRGEVLIDGRDTISPSMFVDVTEGSVHVTVANEKLILAAGQTRVFGNSGAMSAAIPPEARVNSQKVEPLKIAFYDYDDNLTKGLDSLDDAKAFVAQSKPNVECSLGLRSIHFPRDNPRTLDPMKISLGDYLMGAEGYRKWTSSHPASQDAIAPRMAEPITSRSVFVFDGYISVTMPGTYDLIVEADDGDEVKVGGVIVHSKSEYGGMTNLGDPRYAARMTFRAAGTYPIHVLHWDRAGELGVHVFCTLDSNADILEGRLLLPILGGGNG